jgi:hypothetical protein
MCTSYVSMSLFKYLRIYERRRLRRTETKYLRRHQSRRETREADKSGRSPSFLKHLARVLLFESTCSDDPSLTQLTVLMETEGKSYERDIKKGRKG